MLVCCIELRRTADQNNVLWKTAKKIAHDRGNHEPSPAKSNTGAAERITGVDDKMLVHGKH